MRYRPIIVICSTQDCGSQVVILMPNLDNIAINYQDIQLYEKGWTQDKDSRDICPQCKSKAEKENNGK